MEISDSQRAAGGVIAAGGALWNGLMKAGAKAVAPSNARRDFRPLSKEGA